MQNKHCEADKLCSKLYRKLTGDHTTQLMSIGAFDYIDSTMSILLKSETLSNIENEKYQTGLLIVYQYLMHILLSFTEKCQGKYREKISNLNRTENM